MKQNIKIWFSDLADDIDPKNNYFVQLISKEYNLVFDDQNPDYLIFSSYGYNFLNYKNPVKIYYTGENLVPDFNLCDYAIGFHYLDFQDRYLRFPLFAIMWDQFNETLIPRKNTLETLKDKPYFCNYIYSNANANPYREEFYHLLNNYKEILSPGTHLKNCEFEVGKRHAKDWMYSKLSFQSKCKFSIAFENSYCPGYTTEKILHSFISNTIPIYWGNPEISKDFNTEAFINCHDYNTKEEIINRINEIDNNDQLYLKILNASPLIENTIPPNLSEENLLNFFRTIFDQEKAFAYRRPKYGFIERYEKKIFKLNLKKSKFQILKRKLKRKFSDF